MNTLETHAPIKEKIVRANNAPFMNKRLSKAIMTRTRLRNKYKNNPTNENEIIFKKQRNYCVKLSRQSKKNIITNLTFLRSLTIKLFGIVLNLCFRTSKISNKK